MREKPPRPALATGTSWSGDGGRGWRISLWMDSDSTSHPSSLQTHAKTYKIPRILYMSHCLLIEFYSSHFTSLRFPYVHDTRIIPSLHLDRQIKRSPKLCHSLARPYAWGLSTQYSDLRLRIECVRLRGPTHQRPGEPHHTSPPPTGQSEWHFTFVMVRVNDGESSSPSSSAYFSVLLFPSLLITRNERTHAGTVT